MGEIVLLVLLVASIPVAVVCLLVSHLRLKTRVGELEQRIASGAVPVQPTSAPLDTLPSTDENPSPNILNETKDAAPEVNIEPWGTTPDSTLEPVNAVAARRSVSHDASSFSELPPKSFVFRKDVVAEVTAWLAQNWYLAVAALSLAFAGVFLVQYGVENGLLTPFWRVMSAVGLGVALISAGEFVRRRWGDDADGHTAYLPSTFAGAGLVALFAAAVSARQLYDLIGPETAFAAVAAVSSLAVILGWFYGPLLVIIGVIGATAAPFIVGGSSDTPQIFFYYFALIAVAGLLIDAVRRWAWTSVVVLLITHAAALVTFMGEAGDIHYLGFALVTALAASIIPPFQWQPTHSGPTILQTVLFGKSSEGWPGFPARLALGTHAGAVGIAVLVATKDTGAVEVWTTIAAISALYLMAIIWNRRAPALNDLALFAPVALVFIIAQQGEFFGTLAQSFRAELPPESPWPKHVSILSAIALAGSVLAFRRAFDPDRWRNIWTSGAALFAPLMLVVLEIWWSPSDVLGAGLWATHPMIVAAVMTLFAQRCMRADDGDMQRAAIFALSTLTMIAFSLILMLSDTALTTALAMMVLLAAGIDRRLAMPRLALFIQVGAITVGWRLILNPGIFWADSAPIWELWLGYGAAILLLAAAWIVLRPRRRASASMVLESAIWMLGAVFVSVLIYRALGRQPDTHWGVGLIALVGLIAMAGQLYRLRIDTMLWPVRVVFAALYSVWGFGGLVAVATVFNPLFDRREVILGVPIFDTLFVAFAVPAMALALIAWKLDNLGRQLRLASTGCAAGLAAAYVALEIRRAWRGDILAVSGTTGPELYSYTVAMLAASVALLFVAFSRRSVPLRSLAVVGVALTIAKVFLIDMAGLAGLVRVASFLGLGLSLAGLAWVNRLMYAQWDSRRDQD